MQSSIQPLQPRPGSPRSASSRWRRRHAPARKRGTLAALLGIVVALGLGLRPGEAGAQVALPVDLPDVTMPNVNFTLSDTVELDNVPVRPVLVVEVTPDAAHPDLETEIVLTGWQVGSGPNVCPGPSDTFTSTEVGTHRYEFALWNCQPIVSTGFWIGASVVVEIRVTDFGAARSPAQIDVSIRGETRAPTNTLSVVVETDTSPQSIVLTPEKDTVLYDSNDEASNGAGYYLWAGTDYNVITLGQFQIRSWWRLNSLLSFPILDYLPSNAVVTNADLRLWAWAVEGGGGTHLLYRVAPNASGLSWLEGNADPPGAEFTGEDSSFSAANWLYRRELSDPWTTPGGDALGSALSSMSITTTGDHVFSSTALSDAVQAMVDEGNDQDGFLLLGPHAPNFFFFDHAVRFASAQYPSSFYHPELRLDYAPAGPWAEGVLNSGAVTFVGEGEDFRWVYDTDDDGVLFTTIGGVCTAEDESSPTWLPYSYEYQGAPGFTGVDCCTWQIETTESTTDLVGAGQALFYHNLDPLNPANVPPDTDGDGILDLCDNCLNIPNGPLIGSCVGPAGRGPSCTSAADCWSGDTCQFGQEDADDDFMGDACQVPEPGTGIGLLLGGGLLAGLGRRRAR